MSRYHGSKISGTQQSFLTETVISLLNDGRKLWATILFQSTTMDRKDAQDNFFVFIFLPYLQGHGLLRSKHFATMAT